MSDGAEGTDAFVQTDGSVARDARDIDSDSSSGSSSDAGPSLDAATPFAWMKHAIVGDWGGSRTQPTSWTGPTTASVVVHFDAAGTYTAHCLSPAPCLVFAYGTDQDFPGKSYELLNLNADGTGEATIMISFSASDLVQGTLDDISLDPAATTLTFDFHPTWLAGTLGPVSFSLQRAP